MSVTLLPPTARDFEIQRLHLVEFLSTRQIAEKFKLSQTRVRQIVSRVNRWLAQALPVKTELEREQQTQLAQHLAADQLRHQIQQCENYWNGTGDPKYLRQQTRVILALARLGVVPGEIEALAADALDPDDVGWAVPTSVPTESSPDSIASQPSTGDGGQSPPYVPPNRVCSPAPANSPGAAAATASREDVSDGAAEACEIEDLPIEDYIEGAALLESRLLTLLDHCNPSDADRRQSLQSTLARVRREKASLELQLTHAQPGVAVTVPAAAGRAEQRETQALQ